MKKIIVLFPLIFLLLGFSFNYLIDKKIKGVLDQIQTSESYANDMIFNNCSAPAFYFPNPGKLKNLASGEKAEMVEIIGTYVKEYTSSEEFLQKYRDYREMKKPSPPEPPQSSDELRKQQKENMKTGIENMEKTKASLPADQHAFFDETIKNMKEQLKELDNPDNPMFSPEMDAYAKQAYEMGMQQYDEKVKAWETEYPETPKEMLKKWLNSFLDETKDVDFNAELAENESGKKVFVKSSYERKSNLWKASFRAGKETTEAGRKFAQEWLKQL